MHDFDESEVHKKLDLKLWKRLWRFFKPVQARFIAVCVLMVISAVLDATVPLFISYCVNNFIIPQTTRGLGSFAVIYASMFIIQGVITVFFSRHAMLVELESGRAMKRECFIHLQKLPIAFYNTTPVGWLLSRVMSDTNKISGMVAWAFMHLFWNLFYILGVFVFMFALDWRLALTVLAIVPAIAAITMLFKGKLLTVHRKVRQVNSDITRKYNEGISGAKTSKTLVIEEKNCEEFSRSSSEMYRSALRATRLNALMIPVIMLAASAAVSIVLVRGGGQVLGGGLDLAVLSAFISYAVVLLDPVQQCAGLFSEMIATQANVERVLKLLDRAYDITDSPEVEEVYGSTFDPKPENWPAIRGDIEFKNVWFKYPDGEDYVLENFSLKIPAGTNVAIVGETGAGKSTLVNLVCRFFEPTQGQILLDGVDLRQRSQLWLHSNLGYVLQNPHLFSGSILENIRYGKLDATDAEVFAAAKAVSADLVAGRMEKGYDTDVGEGGDLLSTGEKQLISFARAIIADPPIFILDEATSSIDTETELLIQNAIGNILEGRTSFLIAHRLSTIRRADLILVVHEGKIVEQGNHQSLMEKRGSYYALYSAMMDDEADKGSF